MPLISIVMPCFNSEEFIKDSISSVISQTFTDWELIISDNGSSDRTAEIILVFMKVDQRIKLIRFPNKIGVSAARNSCLDSAKGDYIAFLDSDDLWDPTFLDEMYNFSVKNNYDFCCASYRIFDQDSKSLKKDFIVPLRASYQDILKINTISCLTAFVKKDLIGELRMQGQLNEDFLFWLHLLKKTKYVNGVLKTLATYNLRKGSSSSNKFKMAFARWKVYRYGEGFSFQRSLYYFLHYLYYGFKKYYF